MAIKHSFNYSTSDGRPFILLWDWVKTLSAEEQAEYYAAEKRQHKHRQDKIDDGSLIIKINIADGFYNPDSYVWRDDEAEAIGKPNDPTWEAYNNRYIIENKIVSVIERKEI
jgi:hypothetical protein